MPGTCDGKDVQQLTAFSAGMTSTAAQDDCANPGGSPCPEDLCGWSGAFRPRSQHPPLWQPHPKPPQGPAPDPAQIDGIRTRRKTAVGEIRPKLKALVGAMQRASKQRVLAGDEEALLEALGRWQDALPGAGPARTSRARKGPARRRSGARRKRR
ncbi:MAG TPA: hypothetical protein VF841_19060 [Anaeromyxobacter sp.]